MPPLDPVYRWVAPGESLAIFEGDAIVGGDGPMPVRLWMPLKRDLEIRVTTGSHLRVGPSSLRLQRADATTTELSVEVYSSAGRGSVRPTQFDPTDKLARVIVHWFNLPLIHPATVIDRSTSDGHVARWIVEAEGWTLTVDSRPDLSDVIDQLGESDEEFTVTHVGEVRRADGSTFSSDDAENVLWGWQVAMSFALGRWVAPALPVGFSSENDVIWEQWAPWHCDERSGFQSWWDEHTGGDLADFVSAFLTKWFDESERAVVQHLAQHVIAANHSGTTGEAKVMLAQAGLEYLGWVNLVLSGRMSRRQYDKLSATEVLTKLLSEAGIDDAVPAELDALTELAARKGFSGPEAVAWVRNRLTHPKVPDEPYRIEGLLWQTSQLVLEYAELLLLRRVGYSGVFTRRYPPRRWAHKHEVVPWAASVQDRGG